MIRSETKKKNKRVKVEQGEGMGLSPQLQNEGYALLCVSYPRSNLKLVTEKEEKVYDRQFSPNT